MTLSDIEFIILAAGRSSRNYPHTRGLPHKSLLPFGSVKIIDYIVSQIVEAGGKSIHLVVSNNAAIKAFQDNFDKEKQVDLPDDVEIDYIIQKEPKGLAHAISLAAKKVPNRHLAVILPDDLVLSSDGTAMIKKLVDQYVADARGGNLFLTREVEDVSRWGIIEHGIFREKPASSSSHESSIMCFILDKKVGARIVETVEEDVLKAGKGQEVHYSDYLNEVIEQDPEMKIRTIKMGEDDLYLDCGTIQGYEKSLLYSLLHLSAYKDDNLDYLKKMDL